MSLIKLVRNKDKKRFYKCVLCGIDDFLHVIDNSDNKLCFEEGIGSISKHIREVHPEIITKKLKCKYCPYQAVTPQQLRYHIVNFGHKHI